MTGRKNRVWFILGLSLLPLTLVLQELAFLYPETTESVYGRWIYPKIVFLLSRLNALAPFSLAEAILVLCIIFALIWTVRAILKTRRAQHISWFRRLLRAASTIWIVCGMAAVTFLFLWGFNYARPSIAERLNLFVTDIEAKEVLLAGRLSAEMASSLHAELDIPPDRPTTLPIDFATLNDVIDRRLRAIALPENSIQYPTSPVKKLFSSRALCNLGISGIFIPFTGEPSMNALVPDVTVPLVVAHEKAHQRGITNEGEANLAAFLACAGAKEYPYLRYSAYLLSAARLIGAASVYLPEEARTLSRLFQAGPRKDLDGIREFWDRYEGPLTKMAERANDTYLRSQRVPDGVESYGQVTRLLVALHRQGKVIQ